MSMGGLDRNKAHAAFAVSFARLATPFCLFCIFACWLVAVLAGPFGTYEAMTFGPRALYWGGIVWGAVLVGFAVQAVMRLLTGEPTGWAGVLAESLLVAAVVAPLVVLWRTTASGWSEGLEVLPVSITVNTFVISLAIFAFAHLLSLNDAGATDGAAPAEAEAEAPPPTAAPRPEARLLRRLPEEATGDILRLTANNHHVDVITTQGLVTLRLRLTDAIDEMDPVEGFCVHRSHWVTQSAILRVEKVTAHKTEVILSNGDRIPVGRKYRENLVKAGFLG